MAPSVLKKRSALTTWVVPTDLSVLETYLNIPLMRFQVLPSVALAPPTSITQISLLPERFDVKTILVPSGE
jgi:hypothetical protein